MEQVFDILKMVGSLVILPILYWIGRIQQQHHDFRVHVAEKFVTKEDHEKDLSSLREYIKEGFKSLHKRFDRFEEQIRKELDEKEDKKK